MILFINDSARPPPGCQITARTTMDTNQGATTMGVNQRATARDRWLRGSSQSFHSPSGTRCHFLVLYSSASTKHLMTGLPWTRNAPPHCRFSINTRAPSPHKTTGLSRVYHKSNKVKPQCLSLPWLLPISWRVPIRVFACSRVFMKFAKARHFNCNAWRPRSLSNATSSSIYWHWNCHGYLWNPTKGKWD